MSQSAVSVAAGKRRSQSGSAAAAFVLLRACLGIFLIAEGLGRTEWLLDSAPLVERLTRWAADENLMSLSRSYAAALLPGAPVFARLVVLGEIGGGIALISGFWTRLVAGTAALMIMNFHLATGSLLTMEFLTDGAGLVVVAALLAVAIGGRDLPLSARR